MTVVEAIILAIIEGITEFLPVSSTGHMIIASSLMGIANDPFTKTFTVAIQFGAILSVVALYYKRFLQSISFYKKLWVAFMPAAVLGFLMDDIIDMLLSNVLVVAFTLLAGGVVLVFIDSWVKGGEGEDAKNVTYSRAFKIGMFQCIAMIPGVSRSAATIIGGMVAKLDRKTAAEFSFFLAVPTMFAATIYKVFKFAKTGVGVSPEQVNLLLIGNVVGFIVAAIAIKSFIAFLTKYGFLYFGYYRIFVGVLIIILSILGVDLQLI
ncbi:MAG: undecaprenyl-diphosphate phosphatase [Bacteroidia bacterium]|jgi:undecaprenyl-diphosphatase|nr:undecaprenyl-diphosphate phosphatase [Bacteroidota bacterium]MBP6513341.1 undecaprenyl-diphosphate phosphatase [Bacteroidia bacterium]MBP7245566.1 undecaprenyl-diphosphate phosphatase [Bacteroidia bacterium]